MRSFAHLTTAEAEAGGKDEEKVRKVVRIKVKVTKAKAVR